MGFREACSCGLWSAKLKVAKATQTDPVPLPNSSPDNADSSTKKADRPPVVSKASAPPAYSSLEHAKGTGESQPSTQDTGVGDDKVLKNDADTNLIEAQCVRIRCLMTSTIAMPQELTRGSLVVCGKLTESDSQKWLLRRIKCEPESATDDDPFSTGPLTTFTLQNVAAPDLYASVLGSGYDLIIEKKPAIWKAVPSNKDDPSPDPEGPFQIHLTTNETRVWDLSGGLADEGTQVLVYPNWNGGNNQGGKNQTWYIEPVGA